MKRYKALFFVIVFLFFCSISIAGEIKVYDADGQYLGNLLGASVYEIDIYIPSLKVSTEIVTRDHYNYPDDIGDIKEYDSFGSRYDSVVFDNENYTGTLYYSASYPCLIKYRCDGKYYKTNGVLTRLISAYYKDLNCEPYTHTYMGYYQELVETTLPFNIPVAVPLKFITSKGAVVIPLN